MSVAGSQPAAQAGMPPPALAAPFEPIRDGGSSDTATDEAKKKKRGLFGFGKKKAEEQSQKEDGQQQTQPQRKTPPALSPSGSAPAAKPAEKDIPTRKAAASPIQTDHGSYMYPSSPGRGGAALSSSSPRLSSPAGSQIFERDVQESSTVLMPNSPAIPSHITTENHIPPVLDASSEAITDDHLDPDSVEIITHTSHQPASVTVTGAGGGYGYDTSPPPSWADELASSFADRADDSASNYGSLDTTDVRRLSFISFADVVQAEQAGGHGASAGGGLGSPGNRDSLHLAGLTSLPPAAALMNRSPSPIRSPVSSQGGGPATSSPPTSKSGSVKGLELSPSRKAVGPGLASPTSPMSAHHAPVVSGELAIETMSQALRRTGSADLSGVRSLPTSPIEGPSR